MTSMDPFHASWQRAWTALGAAGHGEALRDDLLARYAEPQRHYHTQQHLAECLAHLQAVRHLADHPGEVEMGLWFHDAIYDLQSKVNEAESADWAERALGSAGVDEAAVRRVKALVLATRHQALPVTPDEQCLVDIDLAILAAPAARFAEYEAQVGQEYAWVPAAAYRAGRSAVLRQFLQRASIYSTAHGRAEWEAPARENLQRSLAQLAAA